MDNQSDYRKMAIQKSVEKARQEALLRAKENQTSVLTQSNVQPQVAPINAGNQPKQNKSLDELRKQFNEIKNNSNEPRRTQVVPTSNHSQNAGPQKQHSEGKKQWFENKNQKSVAQSVNANQNRPNNQPIKNVVKTEPQKQVQKQHPLHMQRNVSVMPSALASSTSQSQMHAVRQQPTNNQPAAVETRKQQPIMSSETHSVATTMRPQGAPKYKEVSAFTSAKQAPVTTKIATPKPSTIINGNKNNNMSRLAQARQRSAEQKVYDAQPDSARMKVMFLGGVGEIGKNMTLIEYMNEIVVVDCGLAFPGGDMPGIDLVIPDITYLKENYSKVKAFLITHGHEDHIGALPYVLRDIKAPIYSGRLTCALIENKIKEAGLSNVILNPVKSRQVYNIGKFRIEFVDVNHSIPDSLAIKISTDAGTIFHTGDFKIDFQPIDGRMIDLPRIAEIGREGVDLLLCESTNVEYEGYTLSESTVGEKLEAIFDENRTRRLFVATFSSNIYRVQQILELATKYGRKVALIGRSMLKNLEAAIRVEKLDFPKSLFVDIEKSNKYEDGEILILCTGSQGESNAALSRLASGEYTKVEIGGNDTVIFSSSPIPGNESSINKVINNLYRKGALVIHENVHASGHACIEELKTMHSLIKPNYFIPIHGEYRHLKKHALLAENMGTPSDKIIITDLGDMVEVTRQRTKLIGKVQAGETLVDGYGLGDVSSAVLKERKLLSEEGLVVVVIGIDNKTSKLVADPIVITRGCVYDDEEEQITQEAKDIVVSEIEGVLAKKMVDWEEAKLIIRKPLRNYFLKKTKRSPVILPVIYKINV